MEKVIKVLGKGEAKFKAEKTEINLTFTASDDEYKKCVAKSARDTAIVKEMLTSLGFDKTMLKTTEFYIRPHYVSERTQGNGYLSVLRGYEYEQTLRFSFPSSNETLSLVCDAVSKLKLNPRIKISYGLYDKETPKQAALAEAIKDANKKANFIASNLNLEIDSILDINYGTVYNEYVPNYYSECDYGDGSARSREFDIEPEEILTRDSVTITYKLK